MFNNGLSPDTFIPKPPNELHIPEAKPWSPFPQSDLHIPVADRPKNAVERFVEKINSVQSSSNIVYSVSKNDGIFEITRRDLNASSRVPEFLEKSKRVHQERSENKKQAIADLYKRKILFPSKLIDD